MFKSNLHLWNICRAHRGRRSRSPLCLPKDMASVWVRAHFLLLPSRVNAYFPKQGWIQHPQPPSSPQQRSLVLHRVNLHPWLWGNQRYEGQAFEWRIGPKGDTAAWRLKDGGLHLRHTSHTLVRTHCYTKKSMRDVFKLFTVTLLNYTNDKTATIINRVQLIYFIAVNKIIQSLLELGHYIIHYITVTQWF